MSIYHILHKIFKIDGQFIYTGNTISNAVGIL